MTLGKNRELRAEHNMPEYVNPNDHSIDRYSKEVSQ